MHRDRRQIHEALAVLAPRKRFDLLLLMLSGVDRSVSQLASAVELSQSCTTRHLQALARAGLVKGARDGKRVVFRIAPRDAAARTVLASLSGPRARPGGMGGNERARIGRKRGVRRTPKPSGAGRGSIARRAIDRAIRIESAAEFEPLMAADADPPRRARSGLAARSGPGGERGADARREPADRALAVVDSQPRQESGNNSEAPGLPAWRRSEIEDFLL